MFNEIRDKLLIRKIGKLFKKPLRKMYSSIITNYNLKIVKLIYSNLAKRYGMSIRDVYNCLPLTVAIDKELEGAYGLCQAKTEMEKKLFRKPRKYRKSTIFLNGEDVTTTTFVHEFGHYLRFLIGQIAYHNNKKAQEDFRKLVDILRSRQSVAENINDNFFSRGYFTEEEEENFAKSWEQYLKDGNAPDNKYKKLFNNFRKFIFQDMNKRSERRKYEFYEDLEVKVTPERRQFFDALIIGKKLKKKLSFVDIINKLLEIYIYVAVFFLLLKYANKYIKLF